MTARCCRRRSGLLPANRRSIFAFGDATKGLAEAGLDTENDVRGTRDLDGARRSGASQTTRRPPKCSTDAATRARPRCADLCVSGVSSWTAGTTRAAFVVVADRVSVDTSQPNFASEGWRCIEASERASLDAGVLQFSPSASRLGPKSSPIRMPYIQYEFSVHGAAGGVVMPR